MCRYVVLLFLFWGLAPSPAFAANDLFTVVKVINGKSFVVSSGDTVRLASIEAPNVPEENINEHPGRPGEPLGLEAKEALAALIMGRKIRIDYNPGERDRHNRLFGQVYDEQGRWIQGEMLKNGWAEVYSFDDDAHDVIMKMLKAEREAQKTRRGIWANAYYRIIRQEEAGEFLNRFKIVEGEVKSVNEYHGNIYINFSEHWKGNFAVFISRKKTKAFSLPDLKSLVGKKVRVRGWINYHNAPMIDITHPEQIESDL